MSAIDEQLDEVVEEGDARVFTRTYPAQIVEGDGRTLDVRVVPYEVEAVVADPPDFRPYRERFERGAFERQLRAPDRVRAWLNFEHDQGLRGIVGHGVELTDKIDGLYGRFRVHANGDGDKALQLVNDGLLTGLSLEYVALRSARVGGVVRRVRAHFDRVSLCRFPAYSGAQVLAVRDAQPEAIEPEPEPEPESEPEPKIVTPKPTLGTVPLPDGLEERLRDLGFELRRREEET